METHNISAHMAPFITYNAQGRPKMGASRKVRREAAKMLYRTARKQRLAALVAVERGQHYGW